MKYEISLKWAMKPVRRGIVPIKGAVSREPNSGLFPGFSASGRDVWLTRREAPYTGPGLVLSAVGAQCGKVFRADGRWGVVANTVPFFVAPEHDPTFLWYLVNQPDFWQTGGAAQPYVRVEETLRRRVALPRLAEQRRIANFLDKQVTKLDKLLSRREKQIAVLSERFAAATEAALASDAPQIPLGWSLARAPSYGVLKPEYLADDGVPIVRILNIGSDGTVANSELAHISPNQSGEYSRTVLRRGDVGLGVVGTIGRPFLVTPELVGANVSRAIARLQPKPGVPGELIRAWLRSQRFGTWVKEITNVTAQPVLNMGDLVKFRVRTPRDPDRVVEELRRIEEWHNQLIHSLNKQRKLLRERQQALITAAVTGQIDVTTARGVA